VKATEQRITGSSFQDEEEEDDEDCAVACSGIKVD
jgi:hypothetical protein